MAWETLRTDYRDAVWDGLKKYTEIRNSDGTISLRDVTTYLVYEESFFGAEDANKINTAVNAIMAALEQGTDLYEVFTQFFENQKIEFSKNADAYLVVLEEYVTNLEVEADKVVEQIKADYNAEIDSFENMQEALFSQWFELIKEQLSKDAAGNLQLQIESLIEKEFRHYAGLVNQTTEFLPDGSIAQENEEATTITEFGSDDNGNKVITQTITIKSILASYTKRTTFIPSSETDNKKIIEEYTAGGLAAYVLDFATLSEDPTGTIAGPNKLGMVKIGEGLAIAPDGTLSIDTESVAEVVVENMEDFNETEVEEIYENAENSAEQNVD